jgi:hypothetical protein
MTTDDSTRKMPWHIWVVGILTLLWNGSGAYTIMMVTCRLSSDHRSLEDGGHRVLL